MDAFDEPTLAHLGSSWPFFGFCNVEQRENSALMPANLESAGEPGHRLSKCVVKLSGRSGSELLLAALHAPGKSEYVCSGHISAQHACLYLAVLLWYIV